MTYIEYLDEAANTVADEMRREYGGDEMWKYFEESFNAVLNHMDENILASLAEAWYPEQAEAFPSQAVANTLRVLARAIWSALSSLSTVDGKRLEKVDWDAIDWRPLLERLVDFDKSDVGGIAREIAKEIGRAAGVAPETVEKQIVGFAEAAVTESLSYIDSLKRLLESAKEIDAEAYKEILKRIEETFLPKIRAGITKTSEKISEANAKEFIAAVTETLKAVGDAINTLTKSVEELRKAAAEKPAKPVAAPAITVKGETLAEKTYLNIAVADFMRIGGGYDPLTGEFLAPLRAVWSIVKRNYPAYPDLFRAVKMWLALNRALYNNVFGFGWSFKRVEEEDGEWIARIDSVDTVIRRKSPDLVNVLDTIDSDRDVPNMLYSLLDGKVYESKATEMGAFKGEPVEVSRIIEAAEEAAEKRIAPWAKKAVVPVEELPGGARRLAEVTHARPQWLYRELGNSCPVCGSTHLEGEVLIYPERGTGIAVVSCNNCLTVYRMYPSGAIEIRIPTDNLELWRKMWERNMAKDRRHPFSEKWLENAKRLAETKGWILQY
jgi:6-pyruvoyl-tetrahydropterin synthase